MTLVDATGGDALAQMQDGDVDAVIVVAGRVRRGDRGGRRRTPGAPVHDRRSTPTRRARRSRATIYQVGRQRARASSTWRGRPPLVVPVAETIQTENLNFISYFVPSMLGLSVMQVGIFAAIPLVADREKLILKRLAATPLRRWQLVGSNILMRLLIAMVQAIIIVARRRRCCSASRSSAACCWSAGFVVLGAVAFLALGYVIASFAKTEDAANGHDQRHPVPDDVPVGCVLPDRPDAAVPAGASPGSSR